MRFVMGRFSWILLLAFAWTLPGFSQTAVDEHWSGYDYPKEIPEGVKHHIIVDGDTLWSIAATYLGDPLLWPQVFQANSYIKDPDLIYPGDPIFLDVGVVVNQETIAQDIEADEGTSADGTGDDGESGAFSELDEFSEGEGDEEGFGDEGDGSDEDIGEFSDIDDFSGDGGEFVILPAGDRADMECSTYIYPMNKRGDKLPFDFLVRGGENRVKKNFSFGDVIYLNKGLSEGINAGEVYSVRRPLAPVSSADGKFLGMAIDQVGKIKIAAVQEHNATGIIERSCFELQVGDFLVPFEQEPIPLITELPSTDRYEAFNVDGSGSIVYSEDRIASFGKGHLTNVDLGIDSNVAPGDLFIIYRDNPGNDGSNDYELPKIYLGHGVALKASTNSTVMKIIEAYSEVHVGDFVVPLTPASFVD